jgi:hypothetical protein
MKEFLVAGPHASVQMVVRYLLNQASGPRHFVHVCMPDFSWIARFGGIWTFLQTLRKSSPLLSLVGPTR